MTAPLIICEYCDSVHRHPSLEPGESASCLVCNGPLYRRTRFGIESMYALTCASVVVFLIANCYPIALMESQGITRKARLVDMIVAAWDADIGLVSAIAALTVFLFPLAQIALYLYVLPPLRSGRIPRRFNGAMRLLRQLRPWTMVEVFLIGILVSVVKMHGLADVHALPGLWAFGVLTLLLTALDAFDLRELWRKADEHVLAANKDFTWSAQRRPPLEEQRA